MSTERSRVELYAAIRRDARAGLSNRALQRKRGVGYRSVVAALESAWPKERKPPPKRGSRPDPSRGAIDGWLREDLDAPRKQQHTAKRIFDRLLDEHDATEVSYWMVREYVATRRRAIRIEAGREPAATFIPQDTPCPPAWSDARSGSCCMPATWPSELPEIRMGLIPGAGGTVTIPRRIGRQRTAWMALTAAPIDVDTALDWGLVDDV